MAVDCYLRGNRGADCAGGIRRTSAINTIVGVVWLQLLVPVYFGLVLANSTELPRFVTLASLVVLYSLCIRLMVLGSYSLAYVFQWSALRFSVEGGGVVGEGVTTLQGLLLTPASNQVFWVIGGVVKGMLLGSASLAARSRLGSTRSAQENLD